MQCTKSAAYFQAAQEKIPGGVNSPVRAFGSVGITPRCIDRAEGAHIYDIDGNSYIDFVGSWGPMLLGHAHPVIVEAVQEAIQKGLSFGAPCEKELELAELIVAITGVEMVRMVNSGTEAVMSAIRLARGFTGRDKIIKFEGCYHGHSDSMLVKAGSGLMTAGVPSSAGVPAAVATDTLTAQFNDIESVRDLFVKNKDEIAAIIVEPVAANMGVVPPADGFLQDLRSLCDQHGALLILDEVITGFRLGAGGAQQWFDVQADLVTYGKIIGGGMPVGAYAGRRNIMQKVAPVGPVYQAGTLSGNPVAMAAGVAQLSLLRESPEVYQKLEQAATHLAQGLREIAAEYHIPVCVNQIGSLCCAYFTDQTVDCYEKASQSDTNRYSKFFATMLENGIYLAPSQFEAMFLSMSHTPSRIEKTLQAAKQAMKVL